MPALTKARNAPALDRGSYLRSPKVAAGKIVYAGALVCMNATGFATPGAISTTLKARGRAMETVDNSVGADGAVRVQVEVGIFRWDNSAAGDAITDADFGNDVYIVDDQTVARTSNGGTRSIAGKVDFVDAQGVWVITGLPNP